MKWDKFGMASSQLDRYKSFFSIACNWFDQKCSRQCCRPFLLALKAQSGSHNHYSPSFDEHSVVETPALLSVDIVRLDVVDSSRVRFVRST